MKLMILMRYFIGAYFFIGMIFSIYDANYNGALVQGIILLLLVGFNYLVTKSKNDFPDIESKK